MEIGSNSTVLSGKTFPFHLNVVKIFYQTEFKEFELSKYE